MNELTEPQALGIAKLCYHLWLREEPLPSLHLHRPKLMLNVCTARVLTHSMYA